MKKEKIFTVNGRHCQTVEINRNNKNVHFIQIKIILYF